MSITLPPGFSGEIARLIHGLGEDAIYTPQATGVALAPFRVSVQQPAADPLVGDADQDALLVYVAAGDLPAPPQAFDRIALRGSERTVESAQATEAAGAVIAWVLRVKG